MKKIILFMAVLLFIVTAAFCQGTDIQSDIERVWGYEECIVQPGKDEAAAMTNMATIYLYVFDGIILPDGTPVPPKLKNANGFLSIGVICVAQTAGTPATFADSTYIRLTSADTYFSGDTLWGKPMTLTTNDTIRVGHPTRNSWNQKFNIGDLQQEIMAASGSEHEGYMPAMIYILDIWRVDGSDLASRYKFRVGFVAED